MSFAPRNRSYVVLTTSRRGLPTPLRSVFDVSHALDGLLLIKPCNLFQLLTPLRFAFPFSTLGVHSHDRRHGFELVGQVLLREAPGLRRHLTFFNAIRMLQPLQTFSRLFRFRLSR
jgi:hypothetical protein